MSKNWGKIRYKIFHYSWVRHCGGPLYFDFCNLMVVMNHRICDSPLEDPQAVATDCGKEACDWEGKRSEAPPLMKRFGDWEKGACEGKRGSPDERPWMVRERKRWRNQRSRTWNEDVRRRRSFLLNDTHKGRQKVTRDRKRKTWSI